jgi:hypothetical protein
MELPENPLKLPRVIYPEYHVRWSEEDGEFVATCDWFPSMSFLDRDCVRALDGLADLLLDTFGEEGLHQRMTSINRARGYVI